MAGAVVHGQSDTLLTLKNDKVLCSLGRAIGAGRAFSASFDDDVIQCFEGDGGILWRTPVRYPLGDETYNLEPPVIDAAGFAYFIVTQSNTGSSLKNLIKLDISGGDPEFWNVVWEVRVGSTAEGVKLNGICIDRDGYIIICGNYWNPGAGDEKFLWKVDPSDGSQVWSKRAPLGICWQVAVDSNNNIYVTCERERQVGVGNSAGCLQKYDTDGNLQWGWDSGDNSVSGSGIAISGTDEIYLGTYYSIDEGGGDYKYIQVFNSSGVVQRSFVIDTITYFPYLWTVERIKFGPDSYLYFIIQCKKSFNQWFWLYKTDINFNVQWSNSETDTTDIDSYFTFSGLHKPFYTLRYAEISKQMLRSDSDGAIINQGDYMRTSFLTTYGGSINRQALLAPFLQNPNRLWRDQYALTDKGASKVAIRDSGCFVPPSYPVWKIQAGSRPAIAVDDIFFWPDFWSSQDYPGNIDHGYFRAKVAFPGANYAINLITFEKYFHRLSRVVPKPFRPYFGIGLGYAQNEAHQEFNVNALVYNIADGKYYRRIVYDAIVRDPPNVSYWEEVSAPDPNWNSFAGFGGLGRYDPDNPESTTPQIYTIVFYGVQDMAGSPHPLNGIYYLSKDLGRDVYSMWRFKKNRPGGRSVRAEFAMFFGVEFVDTHEYSNPKSMIWLRLMFFPEAPAYDAGRTYQPGESVIRSGADKVQRCFTSIVAHSGFAPPNGTYWREQTEPWDTWSPTYSYAIDDFSLHAGEWYKCAETEKTTLLAAGYVDCVASDIGKLVLLDGGEYGLLGAYDNDTRELWVQTASQLYDGGAITIVNGTGAGTTDGASTTEGGAHSNQEPPNGRYWVHVGDQHDDYPDYKVVFQSDDEEKNYGCMMDWRGAANQGLPDMVGQNGFASVYPGAIYQWNLRADYIAGDVVVWNGYFFQAVRPRIGVEPVAGTGDWQLLGTPS